MNSEINIYVFDGNQEIYEKIFPKEVDYLKEEFGIIQRMIIFIFITKKIISKSFYKKYSKCNMVRL